MYRSMYRSFGFILGLAAFTACHDLGFADANCVPLPDGALHWWTGDGTGRDFVGGADAILMHGASYAAGRGESNGDEAFSFDGVDAIARVSDTPTLNPSGPFSIMAWAKAGGGRQPNGAIIAKGRPWAESWALDIHRGQWRTFLRQVPGFGGAATIYGEDVVTDVWTHLAMTWDGGRLSFYVDAVVQGSRNVATVNETDGFVGIGNRSEEGFEDDELEFEFAGEVDEIMFFGRALAETEIRAMFNSASSLCKVPTESARGD